MLKCRILYPHWRQARNSWFLLIVSLFLLGAFANAASAQQLQDDGPFIRYQGDQLQAQWWCNGQLQTRVFAAVGLPKIEHLCAFPRELMVRTETPRFPVEVQFKAQKIAAISDIHGQFGNMKRLLQQHGVIDDELNWRFGEGHLLVAGDVLDRGDQVSEALWLLYFLEAQAQQAGGKVHLLLGNHEMMVMANDLRYVHPKYIQLAQAYGVNYPDFYSESTVLGRWLRAKPVIVQINDSLYMHGGLHPDFLQLGLSLSEVNERFRSSLTMSKEEIKNQAPFQFLRGSQGPVWYRGYFEKTPLAENELDRLLQALKVQRIIVGHTTMSNVRSHYQGKVLSIDADLKSGKGGEMLLFENGAWWRGTLAGERLELSY